VIQLVLFVLQKEIVFFLMPSISDPELECFQGRGMRGSPGGYLGTS